MEQQIQIYIKKQPTVLAGFRVLLLPVFSAFYYTVDGNASSANISEPFRSSLLKQA